MNTLLDSKEYFHKRRGLPRIDMSHSLVYQENVMRMFNEFQVCYFHSKYPHLHSANLVSVFNRKFLTVCTYVPKQLLLNDEVTMYNFLVTINWGWLLSSALPQQANGFQREHRSKVKVFFCVLYYYFLFPLLKTNKIRGIGSCFKTFGQ